ncbi:MAG: hypothetical protein RB191_18305 [Terriglobia bacterium]|nr:hypothetical protein [Terriglobia bacterium]
MRLSRDVMEQLRASGHDGRSG